MGLIYKISNDINDKVYIGKTINSLKERWSQHTGTHLYDDSHFHRAILKYGKEHFFPEVLEDNVSDKDLADREIYWISYYDSYFNGYNSTLGGEGALKFPKEKVLKVYFKNKQNKIKTLEELGCCNQVLNRILREENLSTRQRAAHSHKEIAEFYLEYQNIEKVMEICQCGRSIVLDSIKEFNIDTHYKRAIYQIDKNTYEILGTFNSIHEAAKILFNDIEKSKNINAVCLGKNLTAYGYKWAYVENFDIEKIKSKKPNYKKKPVRCIETGIVYESATAAKEIGGSKVSAVCRGERQTAGGYHWEFVKM